MRRRCNKERPVLALGGETVRSIVTIAPLLLALGAAPAAAVPTLFGCQAFSQVPLTMRLEGLAELTGNIILTCSGTAPTTGITGTITISLATQITSKLLSGTTSEALVLVNEPAPGTQVLGTNVFEGIVSGNQVTFNSVPFAAPPGGTSAPLFVS
jgi:hypothetical protein